MGFLEACLGYAPTGYFLNAQGYGDEPCRITKNLGTYTATPVRGRGGPGFPASARFISNTSSSQFVNYQNITAWNVGTVGSFVGWIRLLSATGSVACAFSRGNSPDSFTDRTFNLYCSGGNGQFRIFRGNNGHLCTGTTTLQLGQWYMLGGLYVQGTSVQLYVNGIAEGTPAVPANFSINNPNTRVVKTGSDGTTSSMCTDYEVGPCAIWTSTLLTERQLRTLYAAGMGDPGLVAPA